MLCFEPFDLARSGVEFSPAICDFVTAGVYLGLEFLVTRRNRHDLPAEIVGAGAQLVLLGSGDADLQQGFLGAARRWPGRVAVKIGFDEGLAHRIQAGSDLMLVPSRSEPCGLTQMIAQRYGTLPVVRHTGGLADSVEDVVSAERGTGFVFHDPDAPHLMRAVHRALRTYRDPETWDALQQRVMGLELGWARAAKEYAALYGELVGS